MHRYLSADLTFSEMRTVFRERGSRENENLKNIQGLQRRIFLRQMEAIVFIILQISLQRAVEMSTNNLLFAAWDVYFSEFSVTSIWTNKHVL